VQLQGRLKDLQDRGLGLAAISYDPPEILAGSIDAAAAAKVS